MNYPFHIGPGSLAQLQAFVANPGFSQVVVLADTNTALHCYPILKPYLPAHKLLQINAGEENKTLETCETVWAELSKLNADRYTLLLNVGGGMTGDLGGFCAAAFKRGIRFAQVPTSLLAMVDAAVGGKVGIDFMGLKNQLGVFKDPAGVFVYPGFLQSLPVPELKSGYAEILKHCLIADAARFDQERLIGLFTDNWTSLIRHSLAIKSGIVDEDPLESGIRKALNFGHTVGHAIESYFLSQTETPIPHGFAVAAGIVCESYLSHKKGLLPAHELDKIVLFVFSVYEKIQLPENKLAFISEQALHDKKNESGMVKCTLLQVIGKAIINQPVTIAEIEDSLRYYQGL